MEDDLIDHLFNCSEKRLARLLLRLANVRWKGVGQSTPIALSQETLAEMIGTTRSRVSFFMNRFRKKGYVDYNGKIEVHRIAAGCDAARESAVGGGRVAEGVRHR